jgi:hypothetical protein
MARGKHGTRLHGVPEAPQMRAARKKHRHFAVSDGAADPSIGSLRVVLDNIDTARKLAPRGRGRPLDTAKLRVSLDALEDAQVPIRCHADAEAVSVLSQLPPPNSMSRATARAILRRIVDLQRRAGLRPICSP